MELPGRLTAHASPNRRKISKRASPGSRHGEQPLPSRHASASTAPVAACRRATSSVSPDLLPTKQRRRRAPSLAHRLGFRKRRHPAAAARILAAGLSSSAFFSVDRGARRAVAGVGDDGDGRRGGPAGVARASASIPPPSAPAAPKAEAQGRRARGAPQGLRRPAGPPCRAAAGREGGRGPSAPSGTANRVGRRRRPARLRGADRAGAHPSRRRRPARGSDAVRARSDGCAPRHAGARDPAASGTDRAAGRDHAHDRLRRADPAASAAASGVHGIEVPLTEPRANGYWTECRIAAMGSTVHVVLGDAPAGLGVVGARRDRAARAVLEPLPPRQRARAAARARG